MLCGAATERLRPAPTWPSGGEAAAGGAPPPPHRRRLPAGRSAAPAGAPPPPVYFAAAAAPAASPLRSGGPAPGRSVARPDRLEVVGHRDRRSAAIAAAAAPMRHRSQTPPPGRAPPGAPPVWGSAASQYGQVCPPPLPPLPPLPQQQEQQQQKQQQKEQQQQEPRRRRFPKIDLRAAATGRKSAGRWELREWLGQRGRRAAHHAACRRPPARAGSPRRRAAVPLAPRRPFGGCGGGDGCGGCGRGGVSHATKLHPLRRGASEGGDHPRAVPPALDCRRRAKRRRHGAGRGALWWVRWSPGPVVVWHRAAGFPAGGRRGGSAGCGGACCKPLTKYIILFDGRQNVSEPA